MSIRSRIKCERKGCENAFVEKTENQGFPGWGHVAGLQNEKGEVLTLHLCPACMSGIVDYLKGANINGMG